MANNTNNNKDPKNKIIRINIGLSWLYIPLLVGLLYLAFFSGGSNPQKAEWSDVKEMVASGDVNDILFIRNDFKGEVTIKPDKLAKYSERFGGKVPSASPHFWFYVSNKFDPEAEFDRLNSELPADSQVKIIMENDDNVWGHIMDWFLFPILLIAMWIFMFRGFNRNMGPGGAGGQGGIFSVGKSTGRLADKDTVKVTFKDVAGLYGAKEEVMEIVDFLKNPKKYTALGGKIPKGALLVGPPGTGKTLLAKAVAGEANVPFFSISGSDFVEMFVGVGASRVRDLFRQAKEKAPCIVFIDEIDAVGRARGKNVGFSSNDERENTLNQLLTEMDGFGTNSGVIVLAATNREREEIFKVHIKNLKLSTDFDVDFMAKHTPGFSGADIANVCNEAALTAARKNKPAIDKQDFLDAVDRIVGGLERKSSIITNTEKKSIAHHEAGHAAVSWLLPYANPLFKVTLIPRGQALGAAWYLPEERKLWTKSQMVDEMCALIGGRVAEEIVNGEPSTGAQNDLEKLTQMAYGMVKYYGMSDNVGALSFYDSTGARGYDLTKPYSEQTAEMIDDEVRKIVKMIHDRTYKILSDHKEGFLQMAALLLEKEVIFAEDVEKILGPKAKPADETENETETTETENS